MNIETKIRTIVSAITAINEVLIVFGITMFENVEYQTIYTVVSTIAMIVAWVCSHYFNNDYTPEAAEGTGLTRLLKSKKKDVINGENFFDEAEEEGE